jgi:hypothetical protein
MGEENYCAAETRLQERSFHRAAKICNSNLSEQPASPAHEGSVQLSFAKIRGAAA